MSQYDLHILQNVSPTGEELTERKITLQRGGIITGDSGNAPIILPPGSSGQVLSTNANSDLEWTTISGGGGSVGGVYGINVESISSAKTLTAGVDPIYHYLTPTTSNIDVTLSKTGATAGDRFVIKNNASHNSSNRLVVYNGTSLLDYMYARTIREYIYDGSNWVSADFSPANLEFAVSIGYIARGTNYGTAVGYNSNAHNYGVSLGYSTDAQEHGTAVGALSNGLYYGASLGEQSLGYYYGSAIGYKSYKTGWYNNVIGWYAYASRYGETTFQNSQYTDNRVNHGIAMIYGETTSSAPTELYAAGKSPRRFTINQRSILTFTAMVSAIDIITDDAASFKIEGAIKRDISDNVNFVGSPTTTVIGKDDPTWDILVMADNLNKALVFNAIGDATDTVRWVVSLRFTEVKFT